MLSLKVVVFVCCLPFLNIFGKPLNATNPDPTCGYDACPAYDPDALNVHLVPHSHDDLGWLETFDQYYYESNGVQYIISSVVQALKSNPERRFIQVETGFLKKWWSFAKSNEKQDFIDLINNGQLEIINGGWSMNDEGATHYQSTIDQYTLGFRFLLDNLGECAIPRAGWQIDPFGHSREQASISARLGLDSTYFARFDYRDKAVRQSEKTTDLMWLASANLGSQSQIMTSIIHNHYSFPSGFCFDIVCSDRPIITDEDSPEFNYDERVNKFAEYVRSQASVYPTNNILITMGDDFRYTSAETVYVNMDRLIRGFEIYSHKFEDRPIKLYYSTPSCYAKAVNEYAKANGYVLGPKTDDFLPYAEAPGSYLTGYFSSRPAPKRFERLANNVLQVAKQLSAFSGGLYDNENINTLREALGVMQHHDAITGTEMQHVVSDYNYLLAKGIQNTLTTTDSIISSLLDEEESLGFRPCLLANVSYCPQAKSDKFTAAVYNPLSRIVSVPIHLPVDYDNWKILDPEGNEVTYEITDPITDFSYVKDIVPSAHILTFMAKQIPALSLSLYRFSRVNANVKERAPKNPNNQDIVVGYEDTNIELDEKTGLLKSVTMNGFTIDARQELLYYKSGGNSGVYILNTNSDELQKIAANGPKNTFIHGDVYQGVKQEFSSWAKQIIKVYNDDRSYIEFDWIIGPLDISDGSGKEVVSKFTTSLATNATFYTDSNGREMIQRVRNYRPTFEYTDEHHVTANYHPVNNKIVLKDEAQNIEFAVLTDRSHGGTSLQDGALELLIHRACVQKNFGDEGLTDQQYHQGIVVRGQHYLILGKKQIKGGKSAAAVERDLAIKKHLNPLVFISNLEKVFHNFQLSFVNEALPENVHILTLEPWGDNTILLRLEHILEENEDEILSQEVAVDLSNLFTKFTVTELQEMTLGSNMLLKDRRGLKWPGYDEAQSRPNDNGLLVNLKPMEIRTFLITVIYH